MGIMSAIFSASTIAPKRRSRSGGRSVIPCNCSLSGYLRKRWRKRLILSGSSRGCALKWRRAYSLRSVPPIQHSARSRRMSMLRTASSQAVSTREITLGQAIREALAEEMRRDPSVFVIGEDVAEAGTPFKVLSGLVEEFGPERIMDSPISEAGITGIGVGAAMAGMRPIVDIMFGDFLGIIMDQVANQAAKI